MDFFENEAEESDLTSGGDLSGSDEEAEIKPKKKKKEKKKKVRARIEDDDDDEEEEEEEDPDGIAEEMKDFISENIEEDDDDDDDDDGDDSEEGEERGKRKHDDDDDIDDRLEDEDYDLIEENLGIKVNRKHQHKRIRVMSDEGSDNEEPPQGIDGKQAIRETLFDDDDEVGEDITTSPARDKDIESRNEFGDLDEEEESDIDDFIVDDQGRPISKGKKKKHIIHSDAALQEAQDIFGVDFNFEEFDQYGEEDLYDEEYEEEEEGEEDGEQQVRTKRQKKRATKKSIFDVFEPSELERGHFTDLDNEIRITDVPERFQLRQIPVKPTEEGELEEESEWIYKQAFSTPTVSNQSYLDQEQSAQYNYSARRSPTMVSKIKEALNFMRNQRLEVPFIAFYRKEYVERELNIKDLWKVWQWDEKWTQLTTRRKNLTRLFEKMQNFLSERYLDTEKNVDKSFRPITEQDLDRVRSVQTMEELRDVYQHFILYYGHEIPAMRNAEKQQRARYQSEREGDEAEQPDQDQHDSLVKQATRRSAYSICLSAKLDEIGRQFGLKPSEVGENLRDNYQRHDVQQCPVEPLELAKDYVCSQFSTVEDILMGARHMVAMQIAHDPLVRQAVRQTFFERAKLGVRPTKKGLKLIDEAHACYPMKYLRNMPVKDLKDEQFLKIVQAETDGLIVASITMDEEDANTTSYFEEVRQLYYRDEFSHLVQQWNIQRSEALKQGLYKILYPQMAKELRSKLIAEAKEGIVKACSRRLYNWLKVAPYQAEQQLDEEYDDDDSNNGVRVLGIAFSPDKDTSAFGAMIDGDGVVSDFVRLPYFCYRLKSFRQMERDWKEKDMQKLKEFILNKKPHVIAVSAESREAMMICDDVKLILSELEQEEHLPPINVELVDNEVAMIFENSNKAQAEFREYPPTLRHAVSIARRLQDPLIEFSQLCNPDEDILCLKYHPMQDQVSKEDLLNALYLEFVNRVNEVGVDINRCINFPHTAPLLQFVCGLGPRKAQYLLKILKQNNGRLENRTQLVQLCHMGPKVFINCAGFIKLDTNSLGDSTDTYVDVLDGSRVHPEAYEWARKMAVDALEYDDTAEDANPAGALEEILESPERLKDLDLDAFAEELERQEYGDKHITLYDIRAELNQRYKDLRTPYRSPTNEERFNMLTKETPETFYVGKLVLCRVTGIAYKRPQGEQLDQANPNRNDETGLWECPFCHKDDFPELSEVWSHFDGSNCPGSAVGVKTRLDNGVSGFIHTKNISDKNIKNPEERVKIGMTIHARIIKIDIDRFQVELTCKSSELVDKDNQWKPQKDLYYDYDIEKVDTEKETEKAKQHARQMYIKRVIAHPNFKNIGYKECEKVMASMDNGDVIVRPSSKGADHLTVTWKVCDGILQHIDVKEEKKENAFSLGKSLYIGEEEFEDLDEIIARHIQPMAATVREIMSYRYFREIDGKRDVLEKMLGEEKRKTPSRIPYAFSTCPQYPGKFLLSYMPRNKTRHEYISITPEGIKYRQQIFNSLNSMIRWFKEHFRDPIPGTPASTRTPLASSTFATPSLALPGMTPQVGRPVSGIYGSLPQATPQAATPQFPSRGFPGSFGGNMHGGFQPMATPMMTPMMTPSSFVAPAHITTPAAATPSYQPTPRSSAWPGATPRTPAVSRTPARSSAAVSRTPANVHTPAVPTPVSRTPRSGASPSVAKPGSTAGTDWARAAELWAKQRQTELKDLGGSTPRGSTPRSGTPRGSTPRHKSPRAAVSSSPAPLPSTSFDAYDDSPQGDGTPLIDER